MGFGPHAGNFLASLPLCVDRDTGSRAGTGAGSDRLDLRLGESDVATPVGEGSLGDRDQVTDFAVGEAEAAERFPEFGALPSVEVVPFVCMVEQVLGYVRSHVDNVPMWCDRNRA